ncbi:hypothetical protein HUV48_01340 [Altererythrobacter sp. HHU K3-1]|uniref:Uncharacterized protein n=1 Tax=Qipengyuania atrilutea TaxID=2744473 RepID=A0A850GZL4_9SPHN|nr:hypothetical protein [Actirhodobacter atriluteus]
MRDALLALSDHRGQVLDHSEKSWASVTFSGARHTVTMLFAGAEAAAAAEFFIAALPEHEFTIPRRLVADATICEVEHRMVPSPRMVVRCEILLLVED